jgi:H+/Cl- antiporter ClcA
MRKILYSYLNLLHRYYDKGSTKSVAYLKTLTVLIFSLFLNLYALLIITGVDRSEWLIDLYFFSRVQRYIIFFIITLVVYYSIHKCIDKQKVLNVEMSKKEMRIGYALIIFYLVASVALLTYVIIKSPPIIKCTSKNQFTNPHPLARECCLS